MIQGQLATRCVNIKIMLERRKFLLPAGAAATAISLSDLDRVLAQQANPISE